MYWEKNYTLVDSGEQGPLTIPPRPRVIDPANPYNNVWKSGIRGGDSSVLIGKIDNIDLSNLYF